MLYFKLNNFCDETITNFTLTLHCYSIPLKCLKGTGGRDKRDSIFIPHRKALYDVSALNVKHKVVISSIIHYKYHSMAQQVEQMTMNNNVQGS